MIATQTFNQGLLKGDMGDTLDLRKKGDHDWRAGPGMRLPHKAVFLSLLRLGLRLSWTHRDKRLILEKAVADLFLRGWRFPPFFQQDIPPMLLRPPLAWPATQAHLALSFLLNIFWVTHVC